MNDNTVSTFELGDALSTRCGNTLTGVFVPGSKIALSAYRHVKWNSRDVPTETAGQDPVLIYLAQETTLFEEPVLRSLLSESNVTFATLQELGQKAPRTEYLRISHAYRSLVRACLERLEHAKRSPEVQTDEDRERRISESIIVFYAAECLWHLFEILYMQQNQLVVPQLLDWARFYAPQIEDRATDFLLMAEDASENDDYWTVLKSLVMVGALDVTRAILVQNRKASQPAFKAAELILTSMPVYQEGFPLKKFHSQWEHWHVDAERKIQANTFGSEPELEELLQLVTGNNELWDAGIQESNEWYEFLPGYLLYTKPTCKPFELRIAAANWLNRWTLLRPDIRLNNMSRMISQLMEHDLRLFIYDTQKINDTHWLTTHLIDLIYHSGELKGYFEQNNIDLPALRHSLIYEYGSYLMTTRSLWQLGVDYLDCCKQEGKAAMDLLLPRIPLRSDRHALKLISVARQRGLINVEQEICKVLSRQSFDEERFGNALEWAIRSKDVLLVTGIADFILKNYSKTGNMLCPDVIISLGSRMFVSPRLVFLSKYFEFYELYRNRDFLSAVELLVNLLNSKITPDYFWPSLLIDTVPLLESKDPKIFSKETVAILHHMETELVPIIERNTNQLGHNNAESVFKDYRVENVDEILNIMRLACARNLARALVIENTGLEL
ncbi:nuclear pore complex protein Nup75 [Drosophila obscura]|uniref:nuclear pore complex protein Nup75 n=1 Tax=Drosophila obscura TaxID=7282 RepID=UPI001BB15023|nr:nuclear pore complex protein Nup75 [Drosophila obscura]XP_041448779.1 nuclear pore complex protein Nup75 [Drosophila obscura]